MGQGAFLRRLSEVERFRGELEAVGFFGGEWGQGQGGSDEDEDSGEEFQVLTPGAGTGIIHGFERGAGCD